VRLVLVCEGEEEIGSPHFADVVRSPEVLAELKKCIGVYMAEAGCAAQDEYCLVESTNPKVQGLDRAVGSLAVYLYALA